MPVVDPLSPARRQAIPGREGPGERRANPNLGEPKLHEVFCSLEEARLSLKLESLTPDCVLVVEAII